MNFAWDGCVGNETIIRKMIFGDIKDIKELFEEYGNEKLREIFLENLNRFHGRDRSYWQLILEVSDVQIDNKARGGFRKNTGTRYFPWFLSCWESCITFKIQS